ncbi:MAG: MaoC family dehydratase N-terminal domain-containing protein [Sphingomonadales bacterium]|nr:MaoC family dehydratase N-terminal domain-containing protein [Sphingomonadales bacterium]
MGGDWNLWIGREERRHDRVDPALLARWCATFDRPPPEDGTAPQGVHWCLCTPEAPTATLGEDGHPRREGDDSFLPPVPDLPRRMWASSAVEFLRPLRVGEAVERRSRVVQVTEKQGGSGRLVFVEVEHETHGSDGVAVRERQSLVYRALPDPGTPPAPPPLGDGQFDPASWRAHRMVSPAEPLLFRYSALTFNSHRIHYDRPYAADVENYRGLVVHGPLTATLLLDLTRREFGDNSLKTFTFRGLSPAICGEMLHLVLRSKDAAFELGAFASDGRQVAAATAAI